MRLSNRGPDWFRLTALGLVLVVIVLSSAAPAESRGPVAQPDQTAGLTAATSVGSLAWQNVSSHVGAAPSPRFGAGFAYDSQDGYYVLFGGENASGVDLNDTWILQHGNWTQLNPRTAPSPRWGVAMAYDSALDSVVLFGGLFALPSGANFHSLGETWTFSNGSWSNVSGALASSPHDRGYAAFSYDSSTGTSILFGGWTNNTTYGRPPTIWGDTWSFSKSGWSLVSGGSTHTPTARYGAQMAYDGSNHALILFGGRGYFNHTLSSQVFHDTWTYGKSGWLQGRVAASPPGRFVGGMAYDTKSNAIVLFGGQNLNPNPYLGHDTWSYQSGNWTGFSSHAPSPREEFSFACSTRIGECVAFGGYGPFPPGFLGDTWRLT
jgi:hypothetical protein